MRFQSHGMQGIKDRLGQTSKLQCKRPCMFTPFSRAGMAATLHGVWGSLQCGCSNLQAPTLEAEITATGASSNMLEKMIEKWGLPQ